MLSHFFVDMPFSDLCPPVGVTGIARTAAAVMAIMAPAAALAGPNPGHVTVQSRPVAIPVAVFGEDRRVTLDSDHRIFSKFIGTLRAGKSTICTAFCLGDDVIATASHCLFGTSAAKGPALDSVTFATDAAPDEAAPIAGGEAGLQRQNVISGTQHLNVAPPIDASNDWAVVRLASPVCRAGGLALAPETAVPQPMYQIAMHRDLPDTALRYDGPCQMLDDVPGTRADLIPHDFTDAARLIFHRCDTGPGSSGSPMLIDSGDGPKVAGINIGTYVISHTVVGARAGEAPNQSLPIANTAVKAQGFADAVNELRQRDLLTTRDEVMRLEIGLKRLGFHRTAVQGQLTPALQTAIGRFEASLGQASTGLARRTLLNAIEIRGAQAASALTALGVPLRSARK